MSSSIPPHTPSLTRFGSHAARLRRIDEARQMQQEQHRRKQTLLADPARGEGHAMAMHDECHNTDTIMSPKLGSNLSNQTTFAPPTLTTKRRQNMMQRRIEMRIQSEERKKQQLLQQQEQPESSGQLKSKARPNHSDSNRRIQQSENHNHIISQTHPLNFQQQPQKLPSSNTDRQLNSDRIIKGQYNLSIFNRSQQYEAFESSLQEQRRPAHPHPSISHPRSNPHMDYTHHPTELHNYLHDANLPSPSVTSPPTLNRKQNNHPSADTTKTYPAANLFPRNNHNSSKQNHFRHQNNSHAAEENFSGEPLKCIGHSRNVTHLSRAASPHEFPSDECLYEDGYYRNTQQPQLNDPRDDENPLDNERLSLVSQQNDNRAQIMPHQNLEHSTNHVCSTKMNPHTHQPLSFIHAMKHREHQPPQPDWHTLNRQRLYEKINKSRDHQSEQVSTVHGRSKPHLYSEQHSTQSSGMIMHRQTNVANLSPTELRSKRVDHIQHMQTNNVMEEEESVSVLERARNFEGNASRRPESSTEERRSRSVPREITSQWSSNRFYESRHSETMDEDHSQRHNRDVKTSKIISPQKHPSLIDEDTGIRFVESGKNDFEATASSVQPRRILQLQQNEVPRLREKPTNRRELSIEQQNHVAKDRLKRKDVPPKYQKAHHPMGGSGCVAPSSVEEGNHGRIQRGVHGIEHVEENVEQFYLIDPMHLSIEDRRRRLWDGNERLRASLPKSSSFDSYSREQKDYSPGTASGSTGTSLFKSKFIHAAAVATQQATVLDGMVHGKRAALSQKTEKVLAASSHFTDSTAETTPVGSYGSSNPTQGSISRNKIQHQRPSNDCSHHLTTSKHNNDYVDPSATPKDTMESKVETNERIRGGLASGHTVSKLSVMPPIAETPRLSVGELIARINAVSRSDPVEALAAIDSIIQAEGSGSITQNGPSSKSHKRSKSQFSPMTPSMMKQDLSKFPQRKNMFQRISGGIQEGKARSVDNEEESCSSSEDSTVSSMTNPTFQSIPLSQRCTPKEAEGSVQGQLKSRRSFSWNQRMGKNIQPQFSPPLSDGSDSKGVSVERPERRQREVDRFVQLQPNKVYDVTHSKPFIKAEHDSHCQKNYSTASSKDKDKMGTSSGGLHCRASTTPPSQKANSKDEPMYHSSSGMQCSAIKNNRANCGELESTWIPLPQNNYFDKASSGRETQITHQIKKSYHTQKLDEPQPITQSETFEAETSGLPSIVSDVFSNIDIDLEEGCPVKEASTNSIEQIRSFDAVSQAFSGVNVDFTHENTVSQRRQELKKISKSWNNRKEDNHTDLSKTKTEFIEEQRVNKASAKFTKDTSWAQSPEVKKKVTVEPSLRLKGSRKLAQKFASLVKAYESDA